MNKIATAVIAAAIIGGSTVGVATEASAASKPKRCHSAYTVYRYYLPQHTVKATAKHGSYTVSGHWVNAHTVKNPCK